jgi:ribose 5-phosphate isomerase
VPEDEDDVLLDEELLVEEVEPVPVPVEIGPAAYNATPENITVFAE